MPRPPLPPNVLEHPASFEWTFWLRHVQRAEEAFTALDRLLSNQDARGQHLLRIEPANTHPMLEAQMTEFVRQLEDGNLSDAHDIYRRQMLVVLASLFEGATSDFLTAVFAGRPERMGDLPPDLRPRLPWDILDPANRETRLRQLAKDTGRRVSKMKSKQVLKWVEKLACGDIQERDRGDLLEMLNQRHRIVHERSIDSISTQSVHRLFEVLCDYLKRLSDLAIENGLGVDVGFIQLVRAHAAKHRDGVSG